MEHPTGVLQLIEKLKAALQELTELETQEPIDEAACETEFARNTQIYNALHPIGTYEPFARAKYFDILPAKSKLNKLRARKLVLKDEIARLERALTAELARRVTNENKALYDQLNEAQQGVAFAGPRTERFIKIAEAMAEEPKGATVPTKSVPSKKSVTPPPETVHEVKRIMHARGMKIKQIAHEMGIEDPDTLSKALKAENPKFHQDTLDKMDSWVTKYNKATPKEEA